MDDFTPWVVSRSDDGRVAAGCPAFSLIKDDAGWDVGAPTPDDLKDNWSNVGSNTRPSSEAVKLFQEAKAAFLSVPNLRMAFSKASS
jgi:hypothetical protein